MEVKVQYVVDLEDIPSHWTRLKISGGQCTRLTKG